MVYKIIDYIRLRTVAAALYMLLGALIFCERTYVEPNPLVHISFKAQVSIIWIHVDSIVSIVFCT